MARIHRSIRRRAKSVDAGRVADKAEDYIDGFRVYKNYLKGAKGLATVNRLKNMVKKIDGLDREVDKLERRIDTLLERRDIEAAKLELLLDENLEVVQDCLTAEEYRDFLG